MNTQNDRALAEEITRRKELLLNYFKTVMHPDDARLQQLIAILTREGQEKDAALPDMAALQTNLHRNAAHV
jgi:hypothetical protein